MSWRQSSSMTLGHALLGGLQALFGLDVVAHGLEAGEVLRLVGTGFLQRPGGELVELVGGDVPRGGHQGVVEVALYGAGDVVPAGVPDLAGLGDLLAVLADGVGLGGVVVHAALTLVPRGGRGVVRPVRQVAALERLGLGDLLQAARREPARGGPPRQPLAGGAAVQVEGDDGLGHHAFGQLRVGDQGGGAELAAGRQVVGLRTGAAAGAGERPGGAEDGRAGLGRQRRQFLDRVLPHLPGHAGHRALVPAVRALERAGARRELHGRAARLAGVRPAARADRESAGAGLFRAHGVALPTLVFLFRRRRRPAPGCRASTRLVRTFRTAAATAAARRRTARRAPGSGRPAASRACRPSRPASRG